MSDATVELMPCPFCGGEANIKSISYEGDPTRSDWWVSCQVCRVERPSTKKSEIVHSREEAIAAWNRRAAPVGASVPKRVDKTIREALRRSRIDVQQ